MPPVKESQDQLHNPIEDNSTAKGCSDDRSVTGLLIEHSVRETHRVLGPAPQACNELLFKPDWLVDGVVVALLRERRIFHRQREHVLERIALLDRLPDSLESK